MAPHPDYPNAGTPVAGRPGVFRAFVPDLLWREVGSPEALGERLRLEYERGARHGVPVAVVALHFFLWQSREGLAAADLDRHVVRHFAPCVRASDAVYSFGFEGCYVAVLPHTSSSSASVPVRRLERRALHHPVDSIGPVKLDVVPVDPGVPDVESLLRRLEEHFRTQALVPLVGAPPPSPPARPPVRGLKELALALRTEINLAGRDGSSLSVAALVSERTARQKGQLAADVELVAGRALRATDAVFSVSPRCVAVVLARTRPEHAHLVASRLAGAVASERPNAAYGALTHRVLEFDRSHRDADAFLAALVRTGGGAARIGDDLNS